MFSYFERLVRSQFRLPEVRDPAISRFSLEQRHSLEKRGYRVYALTGQTLTSLRLAGAKFWVDWHNGPVREDVPSLITEVAINPRQLFLPDSKAKTEAEQLALLKNFSAEIAQLVPGTEAIMGNVSDYAQLAYAYLAATGKRLFGKEDNYDFTRTTTPETFIGSFHPDRGLGIEGNYPVGRLAYLWLAPLVIPSILTRKEAGS